MLLAAAGALGVGFASFEDYATNYYAPGSIVSLVPTHAFAGLADVRAGSAADLDYRRSAGAVLREEVRRRRLGLGLSFHPLSLTLEI